MATLAALKPQHESTSTFGIYSFLLARVSGLAITGGSRRSACCGAPLTIPRFVCRFSSSFILFAGGFAVLTACRVGWSCSCF
jgi:hypothetical protein